MEPALGSDVLPAANLKGQGPVINKPFDTGHRMEGLSLQVTAICFLNSKLVDKPSNLKLDVFVTTWG